VPIQNPGIGIERIEAIVLGRDIQDIGYSGLVRAGDDLLACDVERLRIDLTIYRVVVKKTKVAGANVGRG
jgi:hypothetical protein